MVGCGDHSMLTIGQAAVFLGSLYTLESADSWRYTTGYLHGHLLIGQSLSKRRWVPVAGTHYLRMCLRTWKVGFLMLLHTERCLRIVNVSAFLYLRISQSAGYAFFVTLPSPLTGLTPVGRLFSRRCLN